MVIRGNFAASKAFKIITQYFLGAALRSPFAALVLKVANKFFHLGINRNNRLTLFLKLFHLLMNVLKFVKLFCYKFLAK